MRAGWRSELWGPPNFHGNVPFCESHVERPVAQDTENTKRRSRAKAATPSEFCICTRCILSLLLLSGWPPIRFLCCISLPRRIGSAQGEKDPSNTFQSCRVLRFLLRPPDR